jgi:2-dehydro-3-deoxygluconokinase
VTALPGTGPLVLCVGEPLVVLSPEAGRRLDAAESLHVSVGGAEANVAVHLARLGVASRFAGAVGNDPFGWRVQATLAREGVDVSALQFDDTRPTGLYAKDPEPAGTVPYYYRSGSAASALTRVTHGAFDGVTLVHVSGILASLGPGCRAVVESLVEGDVPVSFDVNHRPALWPRGEAASVLRELASRAGTVFVGLDEAADLWGCSEAADVRDLFPTNELVVKDSEHAATAFHADSRVDVSALDVVVVEPVGAGDAFAAGYLSVRATGGGVAQALRTGHAVASTALVASDDHGVPPDPALLRSARTGEGWPDGLRGRGTQ